MKPKKLFHCLLLAPITLLAAVTMSCSCNEKKVAGAVSDANSECPMCVNQLGKCSAITYDKKGKKLCPTLPLIREICYGSTGRAKSSISCSESRCWKSLSY